MRRRIEVADRFHPRTELAFVRRVIAATLDFAGCPDREVAVLLTGDSEIAKLHGEFANDPTPTDVLSFTTDDAIDVVVSVECARREAQRRGHAIRAELALYIVHGILHACGYDDVDPRARRLMREAERTVLEDLGQRVSPVDE